MHLEQAAELRDTPGVVRGGLAGDACPLRDPVSLAEVLEPPLLATGAVERFPDPAAFRALGRAQDRHRCVLITVLDRGRRRGELAALVRAVAALERDEHAK